MLCDIQKKNKVTWPTPSNSCFSPWKFRTQPWKFQKNPWCSMIFLFVEPRWKKISSYSLKPTSSVSLFFHRLGKVLTTSLKHKKNTTVTFRVGTPTERSWYLAKKKRPGTIRNSWRPFFWGVPWVKVGCFALVFVPFCTGEDQNWPMKSRANIRQLETILRNNLPHFKHVIIGQ